MAMSAEPVREGASTATELRVGTGEQAGLPSSIRLDGVDLAVWPNGQRVEPMSAPLMAITVFSDWQTYHPSLIAAALSAEQDPGFRVAIFRGGCGVKVRKVPEWNSPAALLIHGRALMLAHH